jgi:hypothetical protein
VQGQAVGLDAEEPVNTVRSPLFSPASKSGVLERVVIVINCIAYRHLNGERRIVVVTVRAQRAPGSVDDRRNCR